jgi:hypothetical protein
MRGRCEWICVVASGTQEGLVRQIAGEERWSTILTSTKRHGDQVDLQRFERRQFIVRPTRLASSRT